MKLVYAFFAAERYWPERKKMESLYQELCHRLHCENCATLQMAQHPASFPIGDCLIIIPLSGAVQQQILSAAKQFPVSVLYGAYISGNASPEACQGMLRANAAPTLMDTWAVLRRETNGTLLALNEGELEDTLSVAKSYCHVRGATVLKIGETEPWVVSTPSDPACYQERFGVKIHSVPQEELEALFTETSRGQAEPYFNWFTKNSQQIVEPTEEDLWNGARMACALVTLMETYQASAAALACFNLLRTGTTACLGVSYINDCTDRCVSCEGDTDSAITMLLMKKLTKTRLWMANPGLHPDGVINFNHCTSPIHCQESACPCVLRSHHESGIGVSLQVSMPAEQCVTACRISNEAKNMTIHTGVTLAGPYETACRTQMYVRFHQLEHYLNTVLGCHQVFAFEDISHKLRLLAKLFDLQVL